MSDIPTMRIHRPGRPGEYLIINARDFDAAKDKAFDEPEVTPPIISPVVPLPIAETPDPPPFAPPEAEALPAPEPPLPAAEPSPEPKPAPAPKRPAVRR